MAKRLKDYLPENIVVSIFSNPKRQAKVINYFASEEYIDNYLFENLSRQYFSPSMAVNDIHKTLTDMLYLPYKHLERAYGSDIVKLRFEALDIPPLLLFFSKACNHVAYLYSRDSIIMLHNVEMDLARLIAIFFHSLGVNPFKFELDWISYDYNDTWLEDQLNKRRIGIFRA